MAGSPPGPVVVADMLIASIARRFRSGFSRDSVTPLTRSRQSSMTFRAGLASGFEVLSGRRGAVIESRRVKYSRYGKFVTQSAEHRLFVVYGNGLLWTRTCQSEQSRLRLPCVAEGGLSIRNYTPEANDCEKRTTRVAMNGKTEGQEKQQRVLDV